MDLRLVTLSQIPNARFMTAGDPSKLDQILAEARRDAEKRERRYRERALKIYPWICGRCGRRIYACQPA